MGFKASMSVDVDEYDCIVDTRWDDFGPIYIFDSIASRDNYARYVGLSDLGTTDDGFPWGRPMK